MVKLSEEKISENAEQRYKRYVLNAEQRYKRYVLEWFGIEIDPSEQYVTVEQWKFYRLTSSHRQYKLSYYMMIFVFVVVSLLYFGSLLT